MNAEDKRQRRLRLLALGKCAVHCTVDVVPGKSLCEPCLAYHRERRFKILAEGKCPKHPRRDVVTGKTACEECLEYTRRLGVSRYKDSRAKGMCHKHPSVPAVSGTTCAECNAKTKAKHDARRARGKCPSHPNEDMVSGARRCKKCLWIMITRTSGWTEDEYRKAYTEQDGKCALCDRPGHPVASGFDKSQCLVCDHDHSLRRPRGLLCVSCNTALGMFAEDPERIAMFAKRAPAYLSRLRGCQASLFMSTVRRVNMR